MKVSHDPQASGGHTPARGTGQTRSVTRFSDVLKDQMQQFDGASQQGLTMAFAPPMPFADAKPAGAGREVAPPDAVLSSLVHEITVEAPPGGSSSVEIQFDSRILQGLHVRVQKTGDGVEVRFSTSSAAVSRLLTANSDSLAQALVQRGYVAPSISIQSAPTPATLSPGLSRRSGRDGGDRGSDRGGGQKRR